MKNIFKFGLAGIAAVVLSSTLTNSAAQERLQFAGTYNIKGKGTDGTAYTGTMTIAPYGDGYRLAQRFGDETYRGIATDIGDNLGVALLSGGKPQVTIYRVTSGNTMTGFWQDYDNQKEGTEEATVSGATAFSGASKVLAAATWNYSGTYGINGKNPDGSAYTGTMVVSDYGAGYRVRFTSGGTTWRGIATYIGSYLSIAWQAGGIPQVSVFAGNPTTGELKGYYQDYDSLKEGTETATLK